MREFKLKCYESNEIAVYTWDEVEEPIGIVQLAHGMAEWCPRYDRFATFLNKNGYIVIAEDHRGHGRTSGYSEKGTFEGDGFHDTVEDMAYITRYAKEEYKNLPVVLFGHSYGSFLAQCYIEKYGELLAGVILCGTGYMNTPAVNMGFLLSAIMAGFLGEEVPAKTITKMTFSAYDKEYAEEKTKFAWLTRDKDEVAKYVNDTFCGYDMSYGFYTSFFRGIIQASYNNQMKKIPRRLPILISCGEKDPVGLNGKSPNLLFEKYKKAGLLDVKIKIYKDARHEIINEINREEICEDLLYFINKVTNNLFDDANFN